MLAHLSFLLFLVLPGVASAQAFRCVDAGSGQALYTDQPCRGGVLVVPERSDVQKQADADQALDARERQLRREETLLQLEQDRQQREQERLARAQAEHPAASAACRGAREAATEAAARASASTEQVRMARANAALACGQPLPEEEPRIVRGAVPVWPLRPRPPLWRPGHTHGHRPPPHHRPHGLRPPQRHSPRF